MKKQSILAGLILILFSFQPHFLSAQNLAQGKRAYQSSTAYGGNANRAVDGNTDGRWPKKSVTHTRNEQNPWWEVDLGAEYDITKIEIWNRTDCCKERLNNYNVLIKKGVSDAGVKFNGSTITYQSGENSKRTVTGNKKGRYVRIQKEDKNFLSLAEVRVYGSGEIGTTFLFFADPQIKDSHRKNENSYKEKMAAFVKKINAINEFDWPLENVALGKNAYQSSISHNGEASRAVDGNTDGRWAQKSVTHTEGQPNAWWEVDLGKEYDIQEIKVYNRTDSRSEKLTNYDIFVKRTRNETGQKFNASTLNYDNQNPCNETYPCLTTVNGNRTGRYVRIKKNSPGVLSLAEVEVIASTNRAIDPTFMVMGGDLTQWGGGFSTGINVAEWADADWDKGDKFRVFTRYFDRDRSDEAINLPMYVGLGNHDLNHYHSNRLYPQAYSRRMRKYVRVKHQGSDAEVKVDHFDDASGSFSWVIDGVHFMQFHRFGGDNIHNMRQDGQSPHQSKFYLTADYQEPNNSISWIEADLKKHADMPTLVFQHYGWDHLGTEKEKDRPGIYAWWTPAEIKALDGALAKSQKKIIRFNGHSHSVHHVNWEYDSFGNKFYNVNAGSAFPDYIDFFIVHISADKKKVNIIESRVNVSDKNNAIVNLETPTSIPLKLDTPLKEPCGCPPETVRHEKNRTWVEFRLPNGEANQTINIPGGAYSKYYAAKCNRVKWSDQTFICDASTCQWKKLGGGFGGDNLCHGSKGNSPYVFVGKRPKN